MVLFLAGLQAIPEHLYDAAKVDGAGALPIFRHMVADNLRLRADAAALDATRSLV